MTPAMYEQLLETLQQQPAPLARLHALVREAGSPWSESQLHLFLTCMGGIEIDNTEGKDSIVRIGQRTEQEELASAIVEAVRSFGTRPAHAGEIQRRLPGRFVTTEAQIKALARKIPGLEVLGPGLIQLKK